MKDFSAYTYLLINIFTISYPLAQSFEHRLKLYTQWKYLLPAIGITGAFFIVWDQIFTLKGIWSFNDRYTTGIRIGALPLEEWLFFGTVPYACIFIYEVLRYFFPKKPKDILWVRPLTLGMAVVLMVIAVLFREKAYTSLTCSFSSVFCLIHLWLFDAVYQYRFWMAYVVHLIPLFIVNGVLTGLPVVIYNDSENTGIRLGTIPIEDTTYSLLLLMMNLTIYEWLRKRQGFRLN
jgi:lycopene cyclase domain-containing protein